MKKILLTQDKVALVDDKDFEWLNRWKWGYDKSNGYARRVTWPDNKKIYLHRLILNPKEKYVTDHINGDKLDNRRINLRACTQRQNCFNHDKNKNNSSGFKGVSWNKLREKWHVGIWVNRKNIHIGYFNNKTEAGQAYDKAASKYHEEFARLNS